MLMIEGRKINTVVIVVICQGSIGYVFVSPIGKVLVMFKIPPLYLFLSPGDCESRLLQPHGDLATARRGELGMGIFSEFFSSSRVTDNG